MQILEKNERLPFDLGSQKTIPVDMTDPDSIEECKGELVKHIEYAISHPDKVTTPVSVAVDLEAASGSGDPRAAIAQALVDKVDAIASDVRALRDESATKRQWDAYLSPASNAQPFTIGPEGQLVSVPRNLFQVGGYRTLSSSNLESLEDLAKTGENDTGSKGSGAKPSSKRRPKG